MTHPTPPPTSALQKARELAARRNTFGSHSGAREMMAWKQDVVLDFPSIHAELEKVTAERDELLKGYSGMREVLVRITDSDVRPNCIDCDDAEGNARIKIARQAITSFPEIK